VRGDLAEIHDLAFTAKLSDGIGSRSHGKEYIGRRGVSAQRTGRDLAVPEELATATRAG
jgi:hypothetical protein